MPAPKYLAFLSYSHADAKRAALLHRAIERYSIPKGVRRRLGLKSRHARVFRDREEMAASSDIGAAIKQHLANSGALIVICSHASQKSKWVNSEIEYFKEQGGENAIFCVQVEGGDASRLPPALNIEAEAASAGREAFVLDWKKGGASTKDVVMRLMAGLLAVDYEELKKRQAARMRMFAMAWVVAGIVVVAGVSVGVRRLDQAQQAALRTQSLQLARFSIEQTDAGDAALGAKLAFMGLPSNPNQPDRPVVPETERALLHALAEWREIRDVADLPSTVTAVVEEPDSGTLYLGLRDGSIHALKRGSREAIAFAGLGAEVTEVGLSPQGNFLVATAAPNTIAVWEVSTGREVYKATFEDLAESGFYQWSIDAQAKHLAFHAQDIGRGVFLVDLQNGTSRLLEHSAGGFPVCAVLDPRGRLFTTWVGDSTELRIYDASVPDAPKRYTVAGSPRGCAFNDAGDRIAVFGAEGSVTTYYASENYELARSWAGVSRDADVETVAYDRSGEFLAAASSDRRLVVWSLQHTRVGTTATLPTRPAVLALGASGRHALIHDTDGRALLFDLAEMSAPHAPLPASSDTFAVFAGASEVAFSYGERGLRVQQIENKVTRDDTHRDNVRSVSFSPDSSMILTGSDDGTARLWDASNGRKRSTALTLGSWVLHSEFDARGEKVVACGTDGMTRVWNVADGKALTGPSELMSEGNADRCHFDPQSARVLISDSDRRARVWDIATRKCLVAFDTISKEADVGCVRSGPTDAPATVVEAVYSNDGDFIITSLGDGVVRTYDSSTFAVVGEGKHNNAVETLRRCQRDPRLVTTALDGMATIWPNERLGKGIQLKHSSEVRFADFSGDCSVIVTISDDEGAVLWDASSGDRMRALGLTDESYQVGQFSPSGDSILFSRPHNTTVSHALLIDTADGHVVKRFGGHRGNLWGAALSPDGRHAVTGDSSGLVAFWALDYNTGEMRKRVRERVASLTLSPEQRARFLIAIDVDEK